MLGSVSSVPSVAYGADASDDTQSNENLGGQSKLLLGGVNLLLSLLDEEVDLTLSLWLLHWDVDNSWLSWLLLLLLLFLVLNVHLFSPI